MALSDIFTNLQILVRWLHVLFGILWLGNLYFLNFVISTLKSPADAPDGDTVRAAFMLRALKWMRWTTLLTVAMGVTLLLMTYFYIPGKGLGPSGMFLEGRGISSRAVWIFFGMSVAMIMFFSTWFIADPAIKRLLLRGPSPTEAAFLHRRAARSVRTAMVLSGPMLFGMLAPAHYGAISFATVIAAMVLGGLVLWCAARL